MVNVDLEIVFDRRVGTIYTAGESVGGQVLLLVPNGHHQHTRYYLAQRLHVEVKGVVHNYWVDKHSEKIYETEQQCLQTSSELVSEPTPITLDQTRRFPFSIQLDQQLPSSMEGSYGSVRYEAVATLALSNTTTPNTDDDMEMETEVTTCFGIDDNTSDHQISTSQPLIVYARLDLNSIKLSALRPVHVDDHTDFTCCCIPIGSASIHLDTVKSGFEPNERVSLQALVRNGSARPLRHLEVALVQQLRFTAQSRYESIHDEKRAEYYICQAPLGSVGPQRSRRFCCTTSTRPISTKTSARNRLLLSRTTADKAASVAALTIPPVVPPTCESGPVGVGYVLRFCGQPGIEFDIPIVIGWPQTHAHDPPEQQRHRHDEQPRKQNYYQNDIIL